MAIELNASIREDMGKGASRRLRHEAKLPAIVYGAGKEPVNLTLAQKDVQYHLNNEAFYSQVLSLNVEGKKEDVLLRDLQHHPARLDILHIDFQRVDVNKVVHVLISLHFEGEDICPGVKTEGGAISHNMTEVEVECLPKDIPEFITVDVSEMHTNDILHLSDLVLPEGAEVAALKHGEGHDSPVVGIHARKVVAEDEDESPDAEAASEDEASSGDGES